MQKALWKWVNTDDKDLTVYQNGKIQFLDPSGRVKVKTAWPFSNMLIGKHTASGIGFFMVFDCMGCFMVCESIGGAIGQGLISIHTSAKKQSKLSYPGHCQSSRSIFSTREVPMELCVESWGQRREYQ